MFKRHFLIRMLIFIQPIIVLNFSFYFLGYLQNNKSIVFLNCQIKKERYDENKINILCFGTSRFNSGISPEYLCHGMKKINARNYSCENLSFNGQQPGYLLEEKLKHLTSPIDITLIEIFPTKDPLGRSIIFPRNLNEYLNSYINFYISKYSTLNMFNSIFIDVIRKNLSQRYTYCHQDGWEEIIYNNNRNNEGNNRLKNLWVKRARVELKTTNYKLTTIQYINYFKLLKEYKMKTSSILIFVRMPVDETLRIVQDSILLKLDLVNKISEHFPNATVIDATTNTVLKRFHTIENSHLSSSESKLFSYYLGLQISEIVAVKRINK
jgi:hypothetical protein